MKEREKLGSRLGFILISAGCAIGIGNVWKFPYMAGQGGGGAFVLFYLIFLAILGLPVMTMEFSVGRASQKSPVKAYYALEKPGQKWHIHGLLSTKDAHDPSPVTAAAVFILSIKSFLNSVQPEKPCQSLLRSGETGPEMAYPRIYHSDRMLSSDDVLHNRYRLDAELFLYDSYR